MPECFEVMRVATYLKDQGIEGCVIQDAYFLNQGERLFKDRVDIDVLKGARIESIETKAKYTFWQLDEGVLEWHYRFSGIPFVDKVSYDLYLKSIFSLPLGEINHKHIRLTLSLINPNYKNNKEKILNYVDTRCLSKLKWHPKKTIETCDTFNDLPADIHHVSPLSYQDFITSVKQTKVNLKTFLLNQKTLPSGIGNYLACEICAYAKLSPWQPINKLSANQYQTLKKAFLEVRSFAYSTINYDWFIVFNKQHCARCNHLIKKVKHSASKSSQSTYFCELCQQV